MSRWSWPEWHSHETTWPHGEKTKEHFDTKDAADFSASATKDNPDFADFEDNVFKEDGPSSDPDANQTETWLGRWQAGRAQDPDWKEPSYEESQAEADERHAAVEAAREESGFYNQDEKSNP